MSRTRAATGWIVLGSVVAGTACVGGPARPGAEASPGVAHPDHGPVIDKSRPAHEVYQNLSIFTRDDVSAAFFDELMEGISTDLGVGCLHCHDERGLEVVELPPRKVSSREMIPSMWRVVGEVNSTYFPGKGGPVRCWTCHRGAPTPERAKSEARVLPLPSIEPGASPAGVAVGSNLQVLGGLTRAELRQTMRTIASSLGVECGACHVEGDRSSDELERKRIARDMLRMTFEIEEAFFEAGRGPTCWSCHRGSTGVETERR